jgi:Protein of unknown function (DUF3551)
LKAFGQSPLRQTNEDYNRIRGSSAYLIRGTTESRVKKMSKIHRMAAAAAMAVSAVTLLVIAEPASAAPHRPAVDYCLSGEEGTDCSFASKAQCQATASGIRAECYRNDFGKEGETLHW